MQQTESAIMGTGNRFSMTAAELEELNAIRLETGCSESVISEEKKVIATVYKIRGKCGKPPPPPTDRDAMGNYKVPKGGKPLSSVAEVPGPTSYRPQFKSVQKSAPVYSLGEKFFRKARRGNPAPNKYNLAGDMSWGKCKRITMKHPQHVDYSTTGPGPGGYTMPPTIGKGPKITLKAKSKSYKVQGFVSALASEPNHEVPGPKYEVDDSHWNKPVTFGDKQKPRKPEKKPAPNRYSLGSELKGPYWKFATRLKKFPCSYESNPGPTTYALKTTIGKGPKAVVISERRIPKIPTTVPGPDIYHRAGFDLSEPGYTMKYRWFDEKPPKTPGPATYTPEEMKKKSPGYSLGDKCKPTYPSSVYAQLTVEAPAPGTYDVPRDLDKAGKTFGTARKPVVDTNPGPANYLRTSFPLPSAPAYSLGSKPVEKKLSGARNPGPAKYALKYPPSTAYTMASKIDTNMATVGPGPAAYTMPPGGRPKCNLEVRSGASLKSRHSPLKFNGTKNGARLQLMPPSLVQPLIG